VLRRELRGKGGVCELDRLTKQRPLRTCDSELVWGKCRSQGNMVVKCFSRSLVRRWGKARKEKSQKSKTEKRATISWKQNRTTSGGQKENKNGLHPKRRQEKGGCPVQRAKNRARKKTGIISKKTLIPPAAGGEWGQGGIASGLADGLGVLRSLTLTH